MFSCVSTPQLKKHFWLFVLLTFSTLVHAEAVDVMDSVGHVSKTDSRLEAGKFEAGELESSATNLRQKYKYPRWPERRMVNREMIPPPPPGPYMSSALSDFTVKGLSFARDSSFDRDADSDELNDSEYMFESSNAAIKRFNPDRPWPKNLQSKNTRLPSRWMPDNGYRYVNPRQEHNTGTVLKHLPFMSDYGYRMPGNIFPKNRLSKSNPRYTYRPHMNQLIERRRPSMGVNLREPNMNNYGMRSNNPGYRRPESSGIRMYR